MPAPLTLSTGSLYTYGLERIFALAAEAGFDGLEVVCDESHDSRQADYLTYLMHAYGLPILSLHAPLSGWHCAGWQPGEIAALEQTTTLAVQIGAQHVVFFNQSLLLENSHPD